MNSALFQGLQDYSYKTKGYSALQVVRTLLEGILLTGVKKDIILKQKWLQPHVAHHIEFDIAVWMTNAADFLAYPLDL